MRRDTAARVLRSLHGVPGVALLLAAVRRYQDGLRASLDELTGERARQATLQALLEIPALPVVLRRLVRRRLAETDELTDRLTRYVGREAAPAVR